MRQQFTRHLALLGCLVSLAAAVDNNNNNDVVSLILPNVDEQPLVGEVIGSDGPMTTYVINCPKDTSGPNECGMPPDGMTITAGPSVFEFVYTWKDYWLKESCTLSTSNLISCDVTNTQSDFSIIVSTVVSVDLPPMVVTITATATATESGVKSTPTSAATDSSATETPSVTAKPSQTTLATTDAEVNASTEPTPTASDNAALPMAPGVAAQWLISGACMALALAL